MEYLTLNNNVKLPMVGFGTWDVRGEKGKRCILEALEVGYRLIDTAQMYDNEDIVGKAVRQSGLARQEKSELSAFPILTESGMNALFVPAGSSLRSTR